MGIVFACLCGKIHEVDDSLGGTRVVCDVCGQSVKAPATPRGSEPAGKSSIPGLNDPDVYFGVDPAVSRRHGWRVAFLVAAGVTLLTLVAFGTFAALVFRRAEINPDQPGPIRVAPAAAKSQSEAAGEAVRRYLTARSEDELLLAVRFPDRVGRIFEDLRRGAGVKFRAFGGYEVRLIQDHPSLGDGEMPFSVVIVKLNAETFDRWFFVVATPEGPRVDYEASSYYLTSQSVLRYLTEPSREKGPVKLRVLCKLDNVYKYDFTGYRKSHYSVEMSDRLGNSMHGYLPRDAPGAARFAEALRNDPNRAYLLEVRATGPEGLALDEKNDGSCVLIRRLVSHSWVDWSQEGETEPEKGASPKPKESAGKGQ